MSAPTFTVQTRLQCPHGGTVMVTTSNKQVEASEALVVTAGDVWTIVGCPYVIPVVNVPSPCTTVQWTSTDRQVHVNGQATISSASVGVCVGGTSPGPPILVQTQRKVESA